MDEVRNLQAISGIGHAKAESDAALLREMLTEARGSARGPRDGRASGQRQGLPSAAGHRRGRGRQLGQGVEDSRRAEDRWAGEFRPRAAEGVALGKGHAQASAGNVDGPGARGAGAGPDAGGEAAATTPVPHDRVSPTPRSWTRIAMCPAGRRRRGTTARRWCPAAARGRRRAPCAGRGARASIGVGQGDDGVRVAEVDATVPAAGTRCRRAGRDQRHRRVRARPAAAASPATNHGRGRRRTRRPRGDRLDARAGGDGRRTSGRSTAPAAQVARRRRGCRCRTSRPGSRRRCGSP